MITIMLEFCHDAVLRPHACAAEAGLTHHFILGAKVTVPRAEF